MNLNWTWTWDWDVSRNNWGWAGWAIGYGDMVFAITGSSDGVGGVFDYVHLMSLRISKAIQ